MSDLEDELPLLHGTFKIHVIEARGLPDTDTAFFNIDRGDLTDAYVEVDIGHHQLMKTAYEKNNLDPTWDEEFTIVVCHRARLEHQIV